MPYAALKSQLRTLTDASDDHTWPVEMIDALKRAGCFRAAVPREYGGDRLDALGRAAIYEHVAGGSLSAALILTQHDGACELLAACKNDALSERVLTDVAHGRTLATVGISQLTTSQSGGPKPALRTDAVDNGYTLNGVMPWVTSATHADCIVTGAVLDDGRQILAHVPTDASGITVQPPMHFCALTNSQTCAVMCDNVIIGPDHLMRPPAKAALARRSPIKSLTVSIVGIGVAGALVEGIESIADKQPDELKSYIDIARARYDEVRGRLMQAVAARDEHNAETPAMVLRAEVNATVQQLSTTYMILAKGSGYVSSHPAERLAREAMFFLIWSAPVQVQSATLDGVWT